MAISNSPEIVARCFASLEECSTFYIDINNWNLIERCISNSYNGAQSSKLFQQSGKLSVRMRIDLAINPRGDNHLFVVSNTEPEKALLMRCPKCKQFTTLRYITLSDISKRNNRNNYCCGRCNLGKEFAIGGGFISPPMVLENLPIKDLKAIVDLSSVDDNTKRLARESLERAEKNLADLPLELEAQINACLESIEPQAKKQKL